MLMHIVAAKIERGILTLRRLQQRRRTPPDLPVQAYKDEERYPIMAWAQALLDWASPDFIQNIRAGGLPERPEVMRAPTVLCGARMSEERSLWRQIESRGCRLWDADEVVRRCRGCEWVGCAEQELVDKFPREQVLSMYEEMLQYKKFVGVKCSNAGSRCQHEALHRLHVDRLRF